MSARMGGSCERGSNGCGIGQAERCQEPDHAEEDRGRGGCAKSDQGRRQARVLPDLVICRIEAKLLDFIGRQARPEPINQAFLVLEWKSGEQIAVPPDSLCFQHRYSPWLVMDSKCSIRA